MSVFLRLPAELRFAAGATLIKAEDYSRRVAADEVLDAAGERARELVAHAEAEYAAERERGYREGLQQAQVEMSARIGAATAAGDRHLAALEQQLGDIVLEAVRKILRDYDRGELTRQLATEALRRVRGAQRVTLRVAPGNAEGLEAQLRERFPEFGFLEVKSDPGLSDDACVLESDLGIVDASIDTQLNALHSLLRSALAESPAA